MFQRWLKKPVKSTLLLGPRRAGKSTYLKNAFPDFTYLTLDDLDLLDLAEKDPKALLQKAKVIIDEIQRVPRLTIAVKFAIDEQHATVMMSGSSRIGLLDVSADSLAGRIDILNLPPACWGEEFGPPTHSLFEDQADVLQLKEANRRLESFLQYGGFPEVVVAPTESDKAVILNNYRNTYFTRDLSLLSNLENVSGLRAILNHYVLSIGSITQVENFRQESGLSHITAKKYLQSIYASDLGFFLVGYHYGPAKRHIKGTKSYTCDTGMISALGVQCSRGQIVENFVISEIEKRRKLRFYQTDQLYFYKSTSGFEIDLIIQEGQNLKAIEIKATSRPTKKDARNLIEFVSQDEGHRKGFLFYLGQEYHELEGIRFIPVAAIFRGK